jgi:hypothetical protein
MIPKTEMVPLDKVRDNPWRDRIRNPIDPEKVEAIAVSIERNEYWLGTYGRKLKDGTVELAFGHTRLEAAKAQGLKEIPITLQDLSDGQMLVFMASENVSGAQPVVQEAVKAAIKAYAEGLIELEPVSKDTKKSAIRQAPSFIPGGYTSVVDRPYTTDSVARFLGYIKKGSNTAKNSVVAALGVLELEERKLLTNQTASLKHLNVKQILQFVSDVKDREIRGKERTEKLRKEEAEATAERVRLEKEQKERARKAKEEYDASVKREAEALREKNRQEAARLKKERENKAEELKKKENEDVAKTLALEVRLGEIAKEKAEAAKRDEYAPIRREVEHIIFKLEADPSYVEECKALARKKLTPEDRERIRQASLRRGTWFSETFSNLFLPPLTQTAAMTEYRSKEQSKRRAEEAKTAAKEKKRK